MYAWCAQSRRSGPPARVIRAVAVRPVGPGPHGRIYLARTRQRAATARMLEATATTGLARGDVVAWVVTR